jgi:hypothetical protein
VLKEKLVTALNKINVSPRLFHRYDEFIFYTKTKSPSYIYSIVNNIPNSKNYNKSNLSTKSGKFISLALKNFKYKKSKKLKVGLVQHHPLLKMNSYTKALTTAKIKSVKSVPNESELIPLLAFKAVDFILIYNNSYNKLKTKFFIKLMKLQIGTKTPREYLFTSKKNISNNEREKMITRIELLIKKEKK